MFRASQRTHRRTADVTKENGRDFRRLRESRDRCRVPGSRGRDKVSAGLPGTAATAPASGTADARGKAEPPEDREGDASRDLRRSARRHRLVARLLGRMAEM